MSGLISLEEAQAKVLAICDPLQPKPVSLSLALGAVAAKDLNAPEQVPAFDNTAMDGYAIRAEDTQNAPIRLKVIYTLSAGSIFPGKLNSGEAVKIMTGAPMPEGSDAVIMVEKTEPLNPEADIIQVSEAIEPGNHIRRAGDDIQPGQKVLEAGQVLTPARLGMLASLGIYEVPVRKCKVGVMSTGSELQDGPQPLKTGQIRDANRRTLLSLLQSENIEFKDLGIITDDMTSLEKAFKKASKSCDVILTSGGVSMGDFDFVKKILKEQGKAEWLQIAIKPAKPLAFGKLFGMAVFGLPGNPVSSVISYELFARPGIKKMMGHRQLYRRQVAAQAEEDFNHPGDEKTHFIRVIWEYRDGSYFIKAAGQQGSHMLGVLANSNGLLILKESLKAGQSGQIMLIGE